MVTAVREKTRYYFCKYLYWYLEKRIDKVIRQEKQEPEFRDLYMFKGISRLRRKKMDRASMREYLFQTEISCGGIFEAFNYFYFEYTTIDWMEALLEYYGNIEKISEEQKKELAAILRRQDAAAAGLSDAEVIAATAEKLRKEEEELDSLYALGGAERSYQNGRDGENAVRRFLKGTLDIDRITFICFLIFFDRESELLPEYAVGKDRLNSILLECGFSCLQEEDEFDAFILRYLSSDRPEDCLMEEVTRYAREERNFYLYKTFRASRSQETDFKRVMDVREDF